jgi:glycosyltransferase involved in cell wall biosynthesis
VTISFCIITLNEEAHLDRCLKSCRELADEVVIVDSGSTDQTARIAAEHGARFELQRWQGYVAQKNSALGRASHDWAFSIDADEELSPELREEVARIKADGVPNEIVGYSMPRCVLYEGRWIRHGDWYPDRLVRLFRRDRSRFAGGKVHERVEIVGEVHPLNGELYHHSFRDAADHWARCEKYARLWAETQFEQGVRPMPGSGASHALVRILRAYVFRRGFLDGALGWRIATYSARETLLKYSILQSMFRANGK